MRATKLILSAVIAGAGVFFGIIPDCDGAVCRGCGLLSGMDQLQAEIPIIRIAAERNGIKFGSDEWYLLLAIRKSENGGPGKEFGVTHPRAWGTDLDTQAGWAAATITKSRFRWRVAGRPSEFIYFLADRYCPKECDRVGHINWKKNVTYWFERLKNGNDTI